MKPENPYDREHIQGTPICEGCLCKGWQEGFDAAVKYMSEPCTKHYFDEYQCGKPTPISPQATWVSNKGFTWLHRYLCPSCMAKLEVK